MLYKEDVEQSLKDVFTSLAVDGDTIRALTELYKSLPSSKVEVPVKDLFRDEPSYDHTAICGEHFTTRDKLQDLADELNKAEPIDWEDNNQAKFFIEYHHIANRVIRSFAYSCSGLNVYSTNEDFLEIAKERIGEDRLIKLFKEGM